MSTRRVVLGHPVRTAISPKGGSLKVMPGPDFGAGANRKSLKRRGLAAGQVQRRVLGRLILAVGFTSIHLVIDQKVV